MLRGEWGEVVENDCGKRMRAILEEIEDVRGKQERYLGFLKTESVRRKQEGK